MTGAFCSKGKEGRKEDLASWRPLAAPGRMRKTTQGPWMDDTWIKLCSTCGSHVVNLRLKCFSELFHLPGSPEGISGQD